MAATPCTGGTRAKAFITKFEKAKKVPATRPEPSAAMNVRRWIGLVFPVAPITVMKLPGTRKHPPLHERLRSFCA
jgi:hypothetical protein